MQSFERILIMKKSRWIDFGVVCGLFFLAFMFAVLRHDSQIKTMDQAGFALTLPITAVKTRAMLFITALGSPQFLGPVTLVMMLILWWKKQLGSSMWYGAMQFVGYLLVIFFKTSVMRPRPGNAAASRSSIRKDRRLQLSQRPYLCNRNFCPNDFGFALAAPQVKLEPTVWLHSWRLLDPADHVFARLSARSLCQ